MTEAERLSLRLSNERTLLAWIRTATVLVALGYVIAHVAGLTMTVAGLIALVIAAARYQANARGIDGNLSPRAHDGYVYGFAMLVTMIAMLLLILLLVVGESGLSAAWSRDCTRLG